MNLSRARGVEDHMHDKQIVRELMRDGRRSLATSIFGKAIAEIRLRRPDSNPRGLVAAAIRVRSPIIEVRPRNVGGRVYQVPMPVAPRRARRLGIVWLLYSAGKRRSPMWQAIADEVIEPPPDGGPLDVTLVGPRSGPPTRPARAMALRRA